MNHLDELRPEKRHLWLMFRHPLLNRETTEQIRRWRAEDKAAGMPWDDEPKDDA